MITKKIKQLKVSLEPIRNEILDFWEAANTLNSGSDGTSINERIKRYEQTRDMLNCAAKRIYR